MYAGNTIYEIHACCQGQWKTLGTFDDANQAVAEAVRLRRSRCYVGIRVTEAFHDAVNKFAARVIYRYTADQGRRIATSAISQTPTDVNSPQAKPAPLAVTPSHSGTEPSADVQAPGQSLPVRLGVAIVAVILALVTIGVA